MRGSGQPHCGSARECVSSLTLFVLSIVVVHCHTQDSTHTRFRAPHVHLPRTLVDRLLFFCRSHWLNIIRIGCYLYYLLYSYHSSVPRSMAHLRCTVIRSQLPSHEETCKMAQQNNISYAPPSTAGRTFGHP